MLRISEVVQSITDQPSFLQQIEIIDGIIRQQSIFDSKKNQTKNLIMILSDIIDDKDSSPKSKYYCVRIVKYFTDKKYPRFVQDLAYSGLYEDLIRLARTVDPEKPPTEKGRGLFLGEEELGNKFLVFVERCIISWAKAFPAAQKGQKSKFKKSYEELKNQGVILPEQSQIQGSDKQSDLERLHEIEMSRSNLDGENVDRSIREERINYEYLSSYQPRGSGVASKEYGEGNSNMYLNPRPDQNNYLPKPVPTAPILTPAPALQQQSSLNVFFNKIQTPSSPFSVIKNELNDRPHPLTKKSSLHKYKKLNKSSSKYNMNMSYKSHQTSRFFTTNIKIDKNDYDGTVVVNTLNYWQQMHEYESDEIKRFKQANFKIKSILYQDERVQIGFKTRLIYQNVESFKLFLQIILYFDNKTGEDIEEFTNEFEGDQTNLLYSTKRKIDTRIIADDQITHQLLIIPLNILMNLIQMRLSYTLSGVTHKLKLLLPNTVLKFTNFTRITKSQFNKKFEQKKSSIFRTEPFKLSKHFPPTLIKKNLPELVELTNYAEFLDQKSYMQYELGGQCQVVKTEEYLVKVVVRMDMKAVIQIVAGNGEGERESEGKGERESIQQSILYGKFLLQTLQFLLQEDSL